MNKSIVQRYVGLNNRNCEIWVDTAWTSLPDALSVYPDAVLREVSVTLTSNAARTFWAQASDVDLRPCCDKHSN